MVEIKIFLYVGGLAVLTNGFKLESNQQESDDAPDDSSVEGGYTTVEGGYTTVEGGAANFSFNPEPFLDRARGSPCCHKILLDAEEHHGIWMIHFNKLGTYTITNTLIGGKNTWINDKDSEFVISWCGKFWQIGHRDEAGKCNGYVSSPNDALCFDGIRDLRYYVHCINEWVDGAPSKIRATCLDGLKRKDKLSAGGKKKVDVDPRTSIGESEIDLFNNSIESANDRRSNDDNKEDDIQPPTYETSISPLRGNVSIENQLPSEGKKKKEEMS